MKRVAGFAKGLAPVAVLLVMAGPLSAQTSSIGARARADSGTMSEAAGREAPARRINPVYESHAWISVAPEAPRLYRVNDLITVIVRQQRSFQVEADLKSEKKWDLRSQLEEFLKFTDGGVGSAAFRRGMPNVDFSWKDKLDNKGDTSRQDRLTTRITVRVIDVKPNGLLVLEGRGRIKHDEEISTITITGTCRKDDITADNTVLSTQVADLDVSIDNKGAMRDLARRGWIPKLIDWIKPF